MVDQSGPPRQRSGLAQSSLNWTFPTGHLAAMLLAVTPPALQDRTRGFVIAIASAAVFSTTAIFIRVLAQRFGMPPGVLSFWRSVLVAAALALVLAIVRPALLAIRRNDAGFLAGAGLLLAVFNLLWTTSVARCGAALATVLVYTSGAFTALLAWLMLGERLSRSGGVAVVVCLGGCTLVSGVLGGGAMSADRGGVSMGALSGALYALFTVLCRIGARRRINPWTMVLYVFAANSLAQLLILLVAPMLVPGDAAGVGDLLWLGSSETGWALLVGLAIGPTLLGFGLFNMSLAYLSSSEANLVLTLEPALTALVAFAVLGERMSGSESAGSLVIVTGVVLLHFGERRRSSRRVETASGGPGLVGSGHPWPPSQGASETNPITGAWSPARRSRFDSRPPIGPAPDQ